MVLAGQWYYILIDEYFDMLYGADEETQNALLTKEKFDRNNNNGLGNK